MEASSEVTRVETDNGDLQAGLDRFPAAGKKPLVIIGPEAPAVEGAADSLRNDGYLVLGASSAGAGYEASKTNGVRVAYHAGVLVPNTFVADGQDRRSKARSFMEYRDPRSYVIKADGLAAGKGVVLPKTTGEAIKVVKGMLDGSMFGGAGGEAICFQDRIKGREVSALVLVGGGKDDFIILPLTQDHKRVGEGDTGPNTGGTGAYGSVPDSIVNDAQYEMIREAAYKSLVGMQAEGVDYRSAVLYMGLMMPDNPNDLPDGHENDSYLIEYNVRLGDPEAQVILAMLVQAGVDVYRLFRSAAEGQLEQPNVDIRNLGVSALTVALMAHGYPGEPQSGDEIYGLDQSYQNVTVQRAGVTRDGGPLRTKGGRVLYVTGTGETVDEAATHAYAAIGEHAIHFPGMHHRRDIGWQARQAA
jgi:phosphoribosylamine--glycine ligase